MSSDQIFISYAWDEKYNEIVYSFVKLLRENGYNARLDKLNMNDYSSINFSEMMAQSLQNSQFVIVVLSQKYKDRADNLGIQNGVVTEVKYILNDIQVNKKKYIFVCFDKLTDEIIPFVFRGYEIIELSSTFNTQEIEVKLDYLYSKLSGVPIIDFGEVAPVKKIPKPQVIKDFISNISPDKVINIDYYCTKNIEIIKEILAIDFSRFPVDVNKYYETSLGNLINRILLYQPMKEYPYFYSDKINAEEEYLKIAQNIFQNKLSYYGFEKYLSSLEIEEYGGYIEVNLLKAGYNPEEIMKIVTARDCADNFYETKCTRDLWLTFAYIKNVAKDDICINSLTRLYNENLNLKATLKDSGFYLKQKLKMPEVKLKSGESLILPVIAFSTPLEFHSYGEEILYQEKIDNYELYNECKFIKINNDETLKNIICVGPVSTISEIEINISEENIVVPVRQFNFNNQYAINREFCIGSCPHVFQIGGNQVEYLGELFYRYADTIQDEQVIVGERVNKLVIAELEYETTYIQAVYKNNEMIIKNKTLKKGEYLIIDVNKDDIIKITGKYVPKSNVVLEQPHIKNLEIKRFGYDIINKILNVTL